MRELNSKEIDLVSGGIGGWLLRKKVIEPLGLEYFAQAVSDYYSVQSVAKGAAKAGASVVSATTNSLFGRLFG